MLRRARELGYEGDDPGDALARELHVQRLRSLLANGPVSISKAADVLMVGTPGAADHTASLVALANATTDQAGSPVFSARYRLFARATEGAFTCLGERATRESHPPRAVHRLRGRSLRVRSLQAVRRRVLAGVLERLGASTAFQSRRTLDERRVWLALAEPLVGTDEDDETLDQAPAIAADKGRLCPAAEVSPPGSEKAVLVRTARAGARGPFASSARTQAS